MLHTANNIKIPVESLQSLLKVFSMLKIRIWYDEIIAHEYVPDDFRVMCINCGKNIGCSLEKRAQKTSSTLLSQIRCSIILVYLGSPSQTKN